jgi:phosphatidylserine/phosphatidylglycerophosphate/cardiolipin synthase-like enzyme
MVPVVDFCCFCGLQAWGLKSSLRKLQRSRSHIMATYYGFLWGSTVLNLFRCILQMVQTGSSHATLWNVLWLLTRFGEHAAAATAATLPALC